MSFQTVLRTDPFLKNLSFDYNNYHIMLGNKSLLMITPSEIVNLLFSALRLKASHMRRLSPNHLVSDLGFVRLKAPELPFSHRHFPRPRRIFWPSFDPSIRGSTKTNVSKRRQSSCCSSRPWSRLVRARLRRRPVTTVQGALHHLDCFDKRGFELNNVNCFLRFALWLVLSVWVCRCH